MPSSGLAVGAIIVFGIQVTAAGLQYSTQLLFARWGGAAEYGRYAYAFTWAQVLCVPAALGLNLAVLRFVPLYLGAGEGPLLRGIIRRSSQGALAGAVIAATAGSCVVALLGVPRESAVPLIVGMWMLPVLTLVNLHREILRGTRRVASAYGISDILPAATVICLGFAVSRGVDPMPGWAMLDICLRGLGGDSLRAESSPSQTASSRLLGFRATVFLARVDECVFAAHGRGRFQPPDESVRPPFRRHLQRV